MAGTAATQGMGLIADGATAVIELATGRRPGIHPPPAPGGPEAQPAEAQPSDTQAPVSHVGRAPARRSAARRAPTSRASHAGESHPSGTAGLGVDETQPDLPPPAEMQPDE